MGTDTPRTTWKWRCSSDTSWLSSRWRRRMAAVSVVALAWLAGGQNAHAAAPAFSEAPGSPVATGSGPYSVAFSPSGSLLATANATDNTVSVFTVAPGGALTAVPGSPFATGTTPYSVAFSPSGSLLATANNSDSTVSVFSVAASGTLTPIPGSPFAAGGQPTSVAFSPDDDLLATANTNDDTVSVFSVAPSGQLSLTAGSPVATGNLPETAAFNPGGTANPSGTLLATANGDATVSMFSVSASGSLTPIAGSPFATSSGEESVAFSTDGGLLASISGNANGDGGTLGMLSLYSVAAGGALTEAPGSPVAVGSGPLSVAFSSDRTVATANAFDDTVSVVSVASGGELTPVPGSPFAVGSGPLSVAFSPDGSLFATANANDGTVSVYSVGPPNATIDSPATGQVYSVGQRVGTTFACSDAPNGPGIQLCLDDNGGASPSGILDTATPGDHTYAVTAVSDDGQSETTAIAYTVAAPPTVAVQTPAPDARYQQGQTVRASYTCSDGAGGPGLVSGAAGCAAPVAEGAKLDTTTPGRHTFQVTATSQDGQIGPNLRTYTVVAPLPVRCTGRPVTLVELERTGHRVVVFGVASGTYATKTVTIIGTGGHIVAHATVLPNGTFRTTLAAPAPSIDQAVRYEAVIAGEHSAPLQLAEPLAITAANETKTGLRVTVAYAGRGSHTGMPVVISREVSCTSAPVIETAHLGNRDDFTVTLPFPADPGTVAYYRAVTTIDGGFTLRIAVPSPRSAAAS